MSTPAIGLWDGSVDDVHDFLRGGNRTCLEKYFSNASSKSPFTIFSQDGSELVEGDLVKKRRRRHPLAFVHSHIEGAVLGKRESSFCAVDLRGAHAKISKNACHT
jgi:hypothetical protein